MGLHLEMQVRHGGVPGVSDERQRIPFPNPVAFADPERPAPEVRKPDEETAVEFDDDDVSRRVLDLGHEVRALGVFHPVAGDDHRAVRGRHQRLLPAMDGRVRIARLAGENPAAFQPDEIEGEPLVVGGEMVALEGTLTALEHEPLPLERWGDPHGGGRSPNNGATKIECQDQGARRHHEGGPGVGPARDEEGCCDPKQADANRSGEQGCQLRRPGEDRHARDGGCRPEARPPRRLEQLGPILAAKKSRSSPGWRRRFRTSQTRLPAAQTQPSSSTSASAWWL